MGFLTWNSSYEIGIPEMDAQHKKWLEILNEFYDQLNSEEIGAKAKVLCEKAIEYTKFHFSEEEKLMSSMGYPAISEQKAMHASIRNSIEEFNDKLEHGRTVVTFTITNEMKNWFSNHILIEDKKYAQLYLSKKIR